MATLITATEYKTYAGISGTALDAQLAVIIPAMATDLRRWAGRNTTNGFESTARTETYSGNDQETIQLREWPVTTLTSVSLVDSDGNSTTYETSDYRVDSASGVMFRLDSVPSRLVTGVEFDASSRYFGPEPVWPIGFNNISVVYTGGFSTIPDDLKYAMYRLTDIAMAQIRRDPTKKSESLGSYSYSLGTSAEYAEIREQIRMTFGTMQS